MTREEAARGLKYLWIERDENAKLMQQLTKSFFERQEALRIGAAALRGPQPDPDTGLVPCGCGEWIYTIEKGSCMDYHVTAKCSECGWDWFSKDGVGNCSAVFGAFITNGDSKRDEAERFLIENAKANNKLNYCPNCGAKMEDKPCE